jgi:predicted homoserine dehydrogenase-like protein
MVEQVSRTHEALTRVGIVGTGFIASGLLRVVSASDGFAPSRVLTRRPIGTVENVDAELLTSSIQELVDASDIVVECSGEVVHATNVVHATLEAGRKMVTLNSELQVTVGSYFCERGLITEAEGDQPGSLAALGADAVSMGFRPLVYGNMKGFLNHTPNPEDMSHWSKRNGISLVQVTSFTDGTKLQLEQALIANGLGAGIAKRGLIGPRDEALNVAASHLAAVAKEMGCAISDYVLSSNLPPGVFVVAEHPFERPEVLRYLKLGDGPFYTLVKPYHLCHLEMMKTIRAVAQGAGPLLNNSSEPTVNVAAVAKCDLAEGTPIPQAVGGFTVRGEAVSFAEEPFAVPVGLLDGARVVRRVEKQQVLSWDDVEIPESLALTAARSIQRDVLATHMQTQSRSNPARDC